MLPVGFWDFANCENRCVPLLRNSNTQSTGCLSNRLRLESRQLPIRKAYHARMILIAVTVACKQMAQICGYRMWTAQNHALHIHTRMLQRLEENRHLPGSSTAHGVRAGRLTGARPLPTAVATGAASSCAPAACWAGGRAHASPGRAACVD